MSTKTKIPRALRCIKAIDPAPQGHTYLARGPYCYGFGNSRKEAYQACTRNCSPSDYKHIYVQCVRKGCEVDLICGTALNAICEKPCPHCEPISRFVTPNEA